MGTVKSLVLSNERLSTLGRWDLDYHLPPEGIEQYPAERRRRVSTLAVCSKEKRDPSKQPEETFTYVDISSVDVQTGVIARPQEMTSEEAPTRARMVIRAYDVIVSTCRPTRGAIAVVPPELHNQICSTGFAVLRCRKDANPFYLQHVLRLASTSEQFRKRSTGSSYPAILDSDVLETIVPGASPQEQDAIAAALVAALERRERAVEEANRDFMGALSDVDQWLQRVKPELVHPPANGATTSTAGIRMAIEALEEMAQGEQDGRQAGRQQSLEID